MTLHLVADPTDVPPATGNPFYDPAPGIDRPHRPGPVPDPAVFSGWIGQTVSALDATTEADPVAVLVNLLSAAGAIIGPGPFLRLGDDRHPALIWALTVGETSAGRKGAATGTSKRLLAAVDPLFMANNLGGGLSSGEGLIEALKDDEEEGGSGGGQRLWIVESEYATTMIRGRREGSSLSGVLRQAWNGEDLGVMNRQRLRATAPHVGLIGHITPGELRARMQDSEMAGGTYNRFLPVFVNRNLLLPESSGAPQSVIEQLAHRWQDVLSRARAVKEVTLTDPARELWREEVYPALAAGETGDGPLSQFTARSAPYAKRLGMVYALLDGQDRIDTGHLVAAWALVRYARASAAHILRIDASGTGDPRLDKLAAAVRAAGARGLSGDDVYKLTKRLSKPQRTDLTARLVQLPGYVCAPVATEGRPTSVYLYAPDPDDA